jgi:PleD family two-component response regulator
VFRSGGGGGGSGVGLVICKAIAKPTTVRSPSATAPEAALSSPSPSPSRELHVLLVEDDAAMADVVSSALTHRGYRVSHARSGTADVPELDDDGLLRYHGRWWR